MLLIPTLLCPKSWENMSGDATQRFCSYCEKHVHNLEALSVSERLALLSSPAAKICSRYQVAIRRAAPGREKSYARHLLKYGAGVALTGSVLLVLWEMRSESGKALCASDLQTFYRVASGSGPIPLPMPRDLYREHPVRLMGEVYMPPKPPSTLTPPRPGASSPTHIDLQLDPVEIQRLIDVAAPKLTPPQPGARQI